MIVIAAASATTPLTLLGSIAAERSTGGISCPFIGVLGGASRPKLCFSAISPHGAVETQENLGWKKKNIEKSRLKSQTHGFFGERTNERRRILWVFRCVWNLLQGMISYWYVVIRDISDTTNGDITTQNVQMWLWGVHQELWIASFVLKLWHDITYNRDFKNQWDQ